MWEIGIVNEKAMRLIILDRRMGMLNKQHIATDLHTVGINRN